MLIDEGHHIVVRSAVLGQRSLNEGRQNSDRHALKQIPG